MICSRIMMQPDVPPGGLTQGDYGCQLDKGNGAIINDDISQFIGTMTVRQVKPLPLLAVILCETPNDPRFVVWAGELDWGTIPIDITLPRSIYAKCCWVEWAGWNESNKVGGWEIQVVIH